MSGSWAIAAQCLRPQCKDANWTSPQGNCWWAWIYRTFWSRWNEPLGLARLQFPAN